MVWLVLGEFQWSPSAARGVLQGAGHIVAELLACGHVSITVLIRGTCGNLMTSSQHTKSSLTSSGRSTSTVAPQEGKPTIETLVHTYFDFYFDTAFSPARDGSIWSWA